MRGARPSGARISDPISAPPDSTSARTCVDSLRTGGLDPAFSRPLSLILGPPRSNSSEHRRVASGSIDSVGSCRRGREAPRFAVSEADRQQRRGRGRMRTRREHDSLGPVEVPEDRLWGAQTQRSLRKFPDRARPLRLGPAGDPRLRPAEEIRGAGQSAARTAAERQRAEVIVARRRRGHRRQARCRVSAGRVPDRLGHAIQHERQRGDRPPRGPDCSAAVSASTRTTTSTAASRRTTRSRRSCTSPPSRRSRAACCRRSPNCATRSPSAAGPCPTS